MAERRCGTCTHFIFGMRSECGWTPPEGMVFPSCWNRYSVWVDGGRKCPTWELKQQGNDKCPS